MNPKIWGSHAWIFIHSIAYSYPENPSKEEKNAIIDFLNSLQFILPCKTCSKLYKDDIKTMMYSVNKASINRSNLIPWINEMHNKVNKNINKKEWTDKEFEKHYNSHETSSMNKYLVFITLIILFILFYLFI